MYVYTYEYKRKNVKFQLSYKHIFKNIDKNRNIYYQKQNQPSIYIVSPR